MKKIYLILFLIALQPAFGQDTIVKKRTYIPISQYKLLNKPLTQKDSANFMFRNEDTLVLVKNDYKPFDENDMVRVPYTEKDSAFLNIYKSTVYNTDGYNGRNKPTSKLWIEDIKIYFEKSVPRKHRKNLLKFAEILSTDVDSLKITEVNKRGKSNFLVYYINGEEDYNFEPRIKDKVSSYYLTWNGKQQITGASIKIDSRYLTNEDEQLNKLKVLFFGTLGYFRSTPRVASNSLVSNSNIKKELTSIDREILKYHYDFGICKGTTIDSFEKNHKNFRKMREDEPNSEMIIAHPKDYFKASK